MEDVVDKAFRRAWTVYRAINENIDDNDRRRALLQRFIRQHCEAGHRDMERLVVEGLRYLKNYDGLGASYN